MSTLMKPSPVKVEPTTSHMLASIRSSPHPSPHPVSLKAATSPDRSSLDSLLQRPISPGIAPLRPAAGSTAMSSLESTETSDLHTATVGGQAEPQHQGGSKPVRDSPGNFGQEEEEPEKSFVVTTDWTNGERLTSSPGSGAILAVDEQTHSKINGDILSNHTVGEDIEDDFDEENESDIRTCPDRKEVSGLREEMECDPDHAGRESSKYLDNSSKSMSVDDSKCHLEEDSELEGKCDEGEDKIPEADDDVFEQTEKDEDHEQCSAGGFSSSEEDEDSVQYIERDEDCENEKVNALAEFSSIDYTRNTNGRECSEPQGDKADEDIEDDEEDDDQVECADCNRVFANLQDYMDHTCYVPQQREEPRLVAREAFSASRDAESFRGDIVYTPSGSAYILEAGSMDGDRDLSFTPEAIVVRDGQSVMSLDRTLPRIESAVFVPRSPSPSRMGNQIDTQDAHTRHGMTSFHVFDLKSTPADALLPYFQKSVFDGEDCPKPVLMCFICKFSFGLHKTFLRHALNDHSIPMSDTEELLVCKPTVSAIIHTYGEEKVPYVSVLKAINASRLDLFDKARSTSKPDRLSNYGQQDGGYSYHFERKSPSPMFKGTKKIPQSQGSKEERPSVISETRRISVAHSPTLQSMNGLRVDLDTWGRRWSPPGREHLDYKYRDRCPSPATIPPGAESTFKRSRSRSPVSSQHRPGSPVQRSSTKDLKPDLFHSTSTSSSTNVPAVSPLTMVPSVSGAVPSSRPPSISIPSHLGLHQHAPSSSSVSSLGYSMHSFFSSGGCEEHGPGGPRSGECAKCDLALAVSSSSLAHSAMSINNGNGGGPSHMTMSHSRNSCKTLKCPKCNWHYKYQETLEIHMKEKHPDSDAQCVYCLTNQPHPRLARGESYSCGYKPYRCEVCNYSTTTKGNLSIHMQSDKHINNMQDLASGGVDMKLAQHHHHHHQHQQHQQHHQAPSTQSLPPSTVAPHPVTTDPSPGFPAQHEDSPHTKLPRPGSAGHTSSFLSGSGPNPGPVNNASSKHKQSFRCDVCNYETSVARNLRIHMTSEKHTQNMLVMSQSMSQMQQEFTLHQMSQMNQFLALASHQEQQAAAAAAARFTALNTSRHQHSSRHLPTQMFPYDQATVLQMMSASAVTSSSLAPSSTVSSVSVANPLVPSPHSQFQHSSNNFDLPPNLAKDLLEFSGDPLHPMVSRVDAKKLFMCCICNKFVSDSLENIHNHIQFDRTKVGNSDTQVTFSNGTYHCNLCIYKTHLKANFQLHCKTDKHLQKLQLVNHIQEGGPENEWRMASFITAIPPSNSSSSSSSASSPMQICCNACGFYANSSHKMQLHVSTMQHETSAQLFKHLQILERATPPPAHGNVRFYQCTICPANFHTKQRLVLHARSPQHLRKEQSLPLGQVSILSVFLVKEMKESESFELDSAGLVPSSKTKDTAYDDSNSPSSRVDAEARERQTVTISNSSSKTTTDFPPPPLAHGNSYITTNTTATTISGSTDYSGPVGSNIDQKAEGERVRDRLETSVSGAADLRHRLETVANRWLAGSALAHNSLDHDLQDSNIRDSSRPLGDYPSQDTAASPVACGELCTKARQAGDATAPALSAPCPLCGHDCRHQGGLQEHLLQQHRIPPDGLPRLIRMVDMPSAVSRDTEDGAGSGSLRPTPPPPPPASPGHTPGPVKPLPSGTAADSSRQQPSDSLAVNIPGHLNLENGQDNHHAGLLTDACVSNANDEDAKPPEENDYLTPPSENHTNNNSSVVAATNGLQPVQNGVSLPESDRSCLKESDVPPSSSTTSVPSSVTPPALCPANLPGDRTVQGIEEHQARQWPASLALSPMQTARQKPSKPFRPEDSRSYLSCEIDLELLHTQHERLLSDEGVDLAAQERLEREFQDLFRCQTCARSFATIDQLCGHQNELGHLELKQTPRGPGYLCWRKGCNQYFKTASALQVHFREIHARRSAAGLLSPQELTSFTIRCNKCSYSFKSSEARARHGLFHLLQAITQCPICPLQEPSAAKLKQHLMEAHGDEISSDEMTSQLRTVDSSAQLLFSTPTYEQFTVHMLAVNSNGSTNAEKQSSSAQGLSSSADTTGKATKEMDYSRRLPNGLSQSLLETQDRESEGRGQDESDGMSSCRPEERQFLEEYLNSQSMAEEQYHDVSRKFRCNVCRVAFTSQRFLLAHNKTAVHLNHLEKREHTDKADTSLYKSPNHNHHIKQTNVQTNGDISLGQHARQMSPLSPSPKANSSRPQQSPAPQPVEFSGSTKSGANSSVNSDPLPDAKPYKCNICKVSYNNQASIEIHMRSVGHKTRASKLGELVQSGQVDVQQALVEHPDARIAGRQQAQIIADLIHQQATAQAASNSSTAYFTNFQDIQNMAQMSFLQGLLPSSSAPALINSLTNEQLEAYYAAALGAHLGQESFFPDALKLPLNSKGGTAKDRNLKVNGKPELTERAANVVIKQDGKIEPLCSDIRAKAAALDKTLLVNKKEEEQLPANFPHAPIIARPRGFMGRFKPQLHRSLLENFGFECVMHFNEEHTKDHNKEDGVPKVEQSEAEKKDNEDIENPVAAPEVEKNTDEPMDTDSTEVEKNLKEEKKEENKENMDLPELKHCTCKTCHKDFSNVWVLKNHEEEVHRNFVAPDVIETFGQKFKEEWEKNLPKPTEAETSTNSVSTSQTQKDAPPSSSSQQVEKQQQQTPTITTSEMPPPPTPVSTQAPIPSGFDMSQLLPLMGMNLLPMHLPLNLMNIGLQNSLMPSLMMPGMDLGKGFLQPNLVEPSVSQHHSQQQQQQQQQQQTQQQQHINAAAAAQQSQNQKRVRTRISDDQLKVLRQYFDINNSPSEEQISTMAEQTGLPHKVIKHWFRNTLFKERQRNKDSPYNFNNPPSTSIDLDEYDRTGKIPDIKIEPEEVDSRSTTPAVPEEKREESPLETIKEEVSAKQPYDLESVEILEKPPLKIDLAASGEALEDLNKRDTESHSSASSPSNLSSIPSTPTASAPATPSPSPMITASSVNASAPPLTFSLDAYAANIARLEAATFQSMGKRANRTRFTDFQIKTLQDYFERNAYPKDDELEHLSKILNLSARVIVVWFQNARQKARKVYENQPSEGTSISNTQSPPAAGVNPSASSYQRTPGLNYQCKKCNSVFQRYYDLIKHQKNSCPMEFYNNNNNKPVPFMGEDDSNFSYSNDDSNFSDSQIPPTVPGSNPLVGGPRERPDSQPRSQDVVVTTSNSTATRQPIYNDSSLGPLPTTSSTNNTAPSSSRTRAGSPAAASLPSFKCDKCPLTFSRFDMWQEHQKAHSIAPAMFTPFASGSAFGMLQTLAHQDEVKTPTGSAAGLPTPVPQGSLLPAIVASPATTVSSAASPAVSTAPSLQPPVHNVGLSTPGLSSSMSQSPNKRKTDSEDESGEQPRDKRLRTTILPEQLDYLYQQYQMDCNPSRKQLEHIASTVNLKKRVVQVWFQNTRARERKGHYRAHQQLINKRCPFCRALFRAKSALESHLATKHPEEMAKGDINVDLIPDAVIEPPGSSHAGNVANGGFAKHSGHPLAHSPAQSNAGSSSSHTKHSGVRNTSHLGHKTSGSSHASISAAGTAQLSHDLSKFLPPSMPNYMAFMAGAGGLGLPFPGPPAPEMLGQPSFEDPFFKKYMSEWASNMASRHEQTQAPHSHHRRDLSPSPASRSRSPPRRDIPNIHTVPAHARNPSPKPKHHTQPTISSQPLDAHKPKVSSALAPSIHSVQPAPLAPGPTVQSAVPSSTGEEAPLDLSKPARPPNSSLTEQTPPRSKQREVFTPRPAHHNGGGHGMSQASLEMEYLRRLGTMDDSFSETQSEAADPEFMNDMGLSPASPSPSSSGRLAGRTGGSGGSAGGSTTPNTSAGKRYRTQMSATQVKVMKHLFQDYKTPTMAECELLGQEIGLAKRVVQVWFQNARAKEKKAKLNASGGSTGGAELDFPKSPEECKLCSYKYSHKVTVQDHIFTKSHIERVKKFLNASNIHDLDLAPSPHHAPAPARSSQHSPANGRGDGDRNRKNWEEPALASAHLAQLKAIGLNPAHLGFPGTNPGDGKNENYEALRKEKKTEGSLPLKDEVPKQQQQQAQAALELAMNAQMLSALGGYMPGLDPSYLPYMYAGLPGYFPGMGLPVLQPGLMAGAEQMMAAAAAYDPLSYGTPLSMLQIPPAAIASVSEKLSEPGAVLARYTQDCQALADLHNLVSAADLTAAAEATLDVGYICKKCQMVYPAKESCIAHQKSACFASATSLPPGYEPIMKLEQVQYECRACGERFSTTLEFKTHCQHETHLIKLAKFRAARREASGSPSSSTLAYVASISSSKATTSVSRLVSPAASGSHKQQAAVISPPHNNNYMCVSNHNSLSSHKASSTPSPAPPSTSPSQTKQPIFEAASSQEPAQARSPTPQAPASLSSQQELSQD